MTTDPKLRRRRDDPTTQHAGAHHAAHTHAAWQE